MNRVWRICVYEIYRVLNAAGYLNARAGTLDTGSTYRLDTARRSHSHLSSGRIGHNATSRRPLPARPNLPEGGRLWCTIEKRIDDGEAPMLRPCCMSSLNRVSQLPSIAAATMQGVVERQAVLAGERHGARNACSA